MATILTLCTQTMLPSYVIILPFTLLARSDAPSP